MPPINNLTGRRFGMLTVVQQDEYKGQFRGTRWICLCDCGASKGGIRGDSLIQGGTTSCGCVRREKARGLASAVRWHPDQRHGMTHSPVYRIWLAMRDRCYNPNHEGYKYYGGRGIRIEFKDFQEFFAHVGPRPSGMSIDRIDNDGHYAVGNVRWATIAQQNNNRRNSKKFRDS